MKNLPESERPYERFQILGAEALSDAELLSLIHISEPTRH